MVDRREKAKKQLRYTSAKEKAEKQESSFGPVAIKVPKEFQSFSFKKAGVYRLSVMPYFVGKNNPYSDEGFVHYERTYYTHAIGSDNKQYSCPKMNFKKPCPVCEYTSKLDRWGKDEEIYKALKPKTRQIFIIKDLAEKKKGYQIFETSFYFGLGQKIDDKVQANPDRYSKFYYLKDGFVVGVSVKQDSYKGRPNYKVTNIEMDEEREEINASVLDELPCLDDLIIDVSYKEMKKIFEQGDIDKEEETESNTGASEYDAGDEVEFEDENWTIKRINKDGTLCLENDDGDVKKAVDSDDVVKVEEKKPAGKKKPVEKDEDEEDDEKKEEETEDKEEDEDEDENEDDTPSVKKKPAAKDDEDEDDDKDEDDDDEEEEEETKDKEEDEEDDDDDEEETDDDDEDEPPTKKGRGRK